MATTAIMEARILAIQARVTGWAGLVTVAAGLWWGYDPAHAAHQAALVAVLTLFVVGLTLRALARIAWPSMQALAADEVAAVAAATAVVSAPEAPAPASSRRGAARAR
jgi:hypothetical protein